MDDLKEKLKKYDLFYGKFQYLCQTDYHRDFIINIETVNLTNLKIKLIGVISVNYASRVIKDNFKMEDSLLIEDLMPPYYGFHWGIRSFEISNWKIIESDNELERIQSNYNFKLNKISFELSSANISFIFHDLDIEELE